MPKFPSLPRLSIIVPVGNDIPAFEQTLVSVLENRPGDCEVIVPHDGQYDDPFDLGDESRLVVAEDGNLVELVMAGTRAARGEYVHVLADGFQATEGWTQAALDPFEIYDTACVIPVVRNNVDDRIVSAGWTDTKNQLMNALATGSSNVDTKKRTGQSSSVGAYLRASFWRRSVFLSLGDAFLFDGSKSDESVSEAGYVFHQLLQSSDWKSVIAKDCEIRSDAEIMVGEESSVERGHRLGAAKRIFDATNSGIGIVGYVKAAIGCIHRRGDCGQWFGRARSGSRVASLKKLLRPESVQICKSEKRVSMQSAHEAQTVRRAA